MLYIANITIMVRFISQIIYLLFIPCFFHVWIYFKHKNKKQHSRGAIFHTGCEHWTLEKFEGQNLLIVRFVFCWNSTGTQVIKFDPVQYPIFTSVITGPWDMVLEKNLSRTSLQKAPVFLLSSLSCWPTVRGESWVEFITIKWSKWSFSHLFLFFFDLTWYFSCFYFYT